MIKLLKKFFTEKEREKELVNHTWLHWLGTQPWEEIRSKIKHLLEMQAPSSKIILLEFPEKAQNIFLIRKSLSKASSKRLVQAAGILVPFIAHAEEPNTPPEKVVGIFSWVAGGLDSADKSKRVDEVFLDLGEDMEMAEPHLKLRLLKIGTVDNLANTQIVMAAIECQ
ncbi:MAG TPA: hypothetical protein VG895_00080 [Patescibacteria group bacterium]|nr:hypothetical protein [Gammaproteobacteria bacterium]HWA51439.1 hypothetical protein [Patescibacteria group bacterium]